MESEDSTELPATASTSHWLARESACKPLWHFALSFLDSYLELFLVSNGNYTRNNQKFHVPKRGNPAG